MSDDKPETKGTPAEAPAETAALRAKADEYLDLARRAKADFLNYQDRVRRERQEWSRQAVEAFARDFLPALDGLSLARFDDPRLMEALRLIEREILRVLAKAGIAPIETAGKAFDPLVHEAVSAEAAPGTADGAILGEVRRGWTMDGRVIRPAGVRIARAPEPPSESAP